MLELDALKYALLEVVASLQEGQLMASPQLTLEVGVEKRRA